MEIFQSLSQQHRSRPRIYAKDYGSPMRKLDHFLAKSLDNKTRRGAAYNHCGFNKYDHGKMYCSKHKDNERGEHTGAAALRE